MSGHSRPEAGGKAIDPALDSFKEMIGRVKNISRYHGICKHPASGDQCQHPLYGEPYYEGDNWHVAEPGNPCTGQDRRR